MTADAEMNGGDGLAAAREVLAFWFEELAPAQWWRVDPDLDARVAERFGGLHRRLATDVDLGWLTTPDAALAAVIVLDQFSRNIHRGEAAAFSQDAAARALAEDAIAKGLDVALSPERRHFLYMPFMHSEAAQDQARSVALFESLAREMGRDDLGRHAREHKAVIDRFGRFPKRNAVLGRANTAAEETYLAENTGAGA